MSSITILEHANQVVTCKSADESEVLTGVSIIIENGAITRIAPGPVELAGAQHFDCSGCVITPGLIDSHTHAVFGGWRAAEYEMRSRGIGYMEIARRGGGINASVRDVRARSEEELTQLTVGRVNGMLRFGITTVEIKSGYGLEQGAELKQLRAVQHAAKLTIPDITATFLGAHEFPPEYREQRDRYVELLINEMIPAVAEEKLAEFCDVFMEPGVFTDDQTRSILEAGKRYGLKPKLHADELENSGGAELAAQIGAVSADHLGAISAAGIAALAESGTVATLLPGTLFFLGKKSYAPARALIDAGATVALATDFNPGTSPTRNLPLIMTIACSQMGLSPLETLVAATAGGARALALTDGRGTLTAGAPADLVAWAVQDYREIAYRYGDLPVKAIWKRGQAVAF